jgi:hypothetical protein
MRPSTIAIIVLIVVFGVGVAIALTREVEREESKLRSSISGRVQIADDLFRQGLANVVKTDRIVLMLVDAATGNAVALKFDTPFVPPQTFIVGQENARGPAELSGSYYLVGLTDKDGEIFQVSPGEIYGRSETPLPLGSEQVELVLREPFRGSLFNGAPPVGILPPSHPATGAGPAQAPAAAPGMAQAPTAVAAMSIDGTITAAPALAANVSPSDRVVVLAFKPDQSRPVAFEILPSATLPLRFRLTVPPGETEARTSGVYLRVLTDKDGSPFNAAPGEIIGRSAEPVRLGTTGLEFVMDQPYIR